MDRHQELCGKGVIHGQNAVCLTRETPLLSNPCEAGNVDNANDLITKIKLPLNRVSLHKEHKETETFHLIAPPLRDS